MSRHNIIGSEAAKRSPFIIVRHVKSGGMRRRRSRMALTFMAGAIAAVLVLLIATIVIFGAGA